MTHTLPHFTPPLTPIALVLQQVLKLRFDDLRRQGDLDFLQGKRIAIQLRGMPMAVSLGLKDGAWQIDWADGSEDALLDGSLSAFTFLAFGQGDADGLFFQRQLEMSGETELAMELKALLGRVSLLPPLPQSLLPWCQRLLKGPFG
ncbi:MULTISPECIES: SCP2 domain-containing protein [Ferrimonas]|uniref:ubiquinone anaerobic biosynthesis accessory factor UbiT n=1 Tax=Ferrimonas TaxID=44011 RepID=UPI00040F9EE7|nr:MULTISPECIES: SCP2 sterol-binding domain-containing protein [Ferrimonas]USD36814.1 SCP2 sterol-binding domain-containing protein [Ferrimonas sp. SCSIO 43195]